MPSSLQHRPAARAAVLAILLAVLLAAVPAARAADPLIAAAGDIACDPLSPAYHGGAGTATACHAPQTANLISGSPGVSAVLPLGDNQYYCGSLQAFQASYAKSWGKFLGISHPTVGNHEYLTTPAADRTGCTAANANAAGYFAYFGSRAGPAGRGYYSWNLGAWHLISLDSNCTNVGGCGTTSPQGKWLAEDLAANTQPCTLAYWHIPLFSSGGRASANTRSLYTQLYDAQADVVLTGHDHIYERFAQQSPTGVATGAGIREFVAGTGGADHTGLNPAAMANSQTRNADAFGVLFLGLHPASYTWHFAAESGKTFTDTGSATCHRSPDVVVSQAARPQPAQAGGTTSLVVTVRNRGGSPAAGVRLTDVPPAGSASIGTITTTRGTCQRGRPIVCQLGTLAAGAAVTIRIAVHTPRVGRIANSASASSTGGELTTANNAAALSIPVVPTREGCTVAGTAGNDTLFGTDGPDVICGLGGNDVIHGLGGNDVILGGSGNDRISGDSGRDRISGGSGNDVLFGGSGSDVLSGSSGRDRLSGGSGNDHLSGGSGRDLLDGGPGADVLRAHDHTRDLIRGGSGRDRVIADRRDVVSGAERVHRL